MGQIKTSQKIFLLTLLLSMTAMSLSGCVYYNNMSWDEMTPEEREEARQSFEEERRDLEESFPDDSVDNEFTQYILDKVEQALESED